jgi:hypothetical protein
VFCNGSNLNDEHILAEWLKLLVNPSENSRTDTTVDFNKPIAEVDHQRKQGSCFSIVPRPKAICFGCNGGWMSLLEQAAKPLLIPLVLGENSVIPHEDARIIAAWATKIAIVSEYRDIGTPTVQSDARIFLMDRVTPPPNTTVWLARHPVGQNNGLRQQPLYWPGAPLVLPPLERPHEVMNTNFTDIVAGHLELMVMTSSNPHVADYRIEGFADRVMKIWPNNGKAIDFTPAAYFYGEQFDELRQRIMSA